MTAGRGAAPFVISARKGESSLTICDEDLRVCRDHLAAVQVIAFAGQVADQAARLEHEQAPGGNVPGIEPDFPEAVVEARGDVGEIERGGTGSPDARRMHDHRPHHRQIGVEVAAIAKREAGADQAFAQMLALADADAAVVQIRAAPARRGEQVVAHRIEDHGLRDHAAVRERDRHAVLREPVEEVRRSVQRVDDPHVLGRRIPAMGRAFLCENRVVRIGCEHGLDDRCFRRAVHLADEVLRALRRDGEQVDIARAAIDDVAGAACRLDGGREHRVHEGNAARGPRRRGGRERRYSNRSPIRPAALTIARLEPMANASTSLHASIGSASCS